MTAPVRPTDDPTWAALDRIVRAAEPSVRRAFLAAVREMRAGIDLTALEQALLRKDSAAVLELVPLPAFRDAIADISAQLEPVREQAFTIGGERIATQLQLGAIALRGSTDPASVELSFPVVSVDVRRAIEEHAAERVRDITEETRRALRDVVQHTYDAGQHPRQAAREIRRIVGLTQKQAAAVTRYRLSIEQQTPKLKPARVDALVERYSNRLLKQRAETIAQTEAAQAANDGQRAQWENLTHAGLLDARDFEREWLAVENSAATCKRCRLLDGKRAPIGGVFIGDVKGPSKGPPLHPRCRCTEALVPRLAVDAGVPIA